MGGKAATVMWMAFTWVLAACTPISCGRSRLSAIDIRRRLFPMLHHRVQRPRGFLSRTQAENREKDIRGLSDLVSLTDDDMAEAITGYKVWGPPALLVAGFETPEISMIKEILDLTGSGFVPIIPLDGDMLNQPVVDLVALPEPSWVREPWAYNPPRGGNTWGSDRVVIFSGLSIPEQGVLLDLLERGPMRFPQIFPGLATIENKNEPSGKVMADAVSSYRRRLEAKEPKEKSMWREAEPVAEPKPNHISEPKPNDISESMALGSEEYQRSMSEMVEAEVRRIEERVSFF
ncbi:hypothetical protein AAMO2058_001109100 [Amorphochlora amoebiformis]